MFNQFILNNLGQIKYFKQLLGAQMTVIRPGLVLHSGDSIFLYNDTGGIRPLIIVRRMSMGRYHLLVDTPYLDMVVPILHQAGGQLYDQQFAATIPLLSIQSIMFPLLGDTIMAKLGATFKRDIFGVIRNKEGEGVCLFSEEIRNGKKTSILSINPTAPEMATVAELITGLCHKMDHSDHFRIAELVYPRMDTKNRATLLAALGQIHLSRQCMEADIMERECGWLYTIIQCLYLLHPNESVRATVQCLISAQVTYLDKAGVERPAETIEKLTLLPLRDGVVHGAMYDKIMRERETSSCGTRINGELSYTNLFCLLRSVYEWLAAEVFLPAGGLPTGAS